VLDTRVGRIMAVPWVGPVGSGQHPNRPRISAVDARTTRRTSAVCADDFPEYARGLRRGGDGLQVPARSRCGS